MCTKTKSSAERFLLRVRYIWKEWSDIRMKIIILKGLCINFLPCSISWLRQVDQHIFMFRQKNMEMAQPINLILLHVCFYRFSIPTLLAHPHKEIIFLYFFHG